MDCNVCGYVREVGPHQYTSVCDIDCNECGGVRTAPHAYDNACDADCNECGTERETAHSYSGDDDLVCNVCKHSLTPPQPVAESVEATRVILQAVAGCEYSKDGENWQDSPTFEGLDPKTAYVFYLRVKQTDTANESGASEGLTVTTLKALILGDVDGDDVITSTDARLTLQYYAGKVGEGDLLTEVADVDGDGAITSTDARLILQKYAGKIEDFPAE
jgi:hypothetical protein